VDSFEELALHWPLSASRVYSKDRAQRGMWSATVVVSPFRVTTLYFILRIECHVGFTPV
jgi:hypothetical protein